MRVRESEIQMATIRRYGPLAHLRAESNEHVLHYKRGALSVQGRGLAYWFMPLSAAVAQVPSEDIDTTVLLRERTADFQEVAVQCTVTYRIADPERASTRVNFSIGLDTGVWKEQPLERLATLWAQRAQQPTRAYLSTVPVVDAIRDGAQRIRAALDAALGADTDLTAMGLVVVGVQVNKVSPTAELEKAIQTPTRESLQQKADEAVFERRALAVEKERVIKENELQSEIALARRQQDLIKQQGANTLLDIQQQAEADRQRLVAEGERSDLAAQHTRRDAITVAEGQARATALQKDVDVEAERGRLAVFRDAPASVLTAFTLQEVANKIDTIHHLNITPDLLGQLAHQLLQDKAS